MKVMYDPKNGKAKKRTAKLTIEFIRKWQIENIQRGLAISHSSEKNSK